MHTEDVPAHRDVLRGVSDRDEQHCLHIFKNFFAFLRDPSFVPAFRDVLLGDGRVGFSGDPSWSREEHHLQHSCLSLERQLTLRKRLDASIKVTLDTDSRGYGTATLHSESNAFFAIAIRLPDLDSDVLGTKLRASYKVSDGRNVHPSEAQDAKEIDGLLRKLNLSDLREDASLFYIAVGEIQETDQA